MLHRKNLWAFAFAISFSGLPLGCDGGSSGGDGGAGGEVSGPALGADGGAGGGDGGAGGEDTGSAQEHVNLFECGLPYTCQEIYSHIDSEPLSAMLCGAKLIVSGEVGVLGTLDDPGGGCGQTQRIYVLLGDGTALFQERGRTSDDPFVSFCTDDIPWQAPAAQKICPVVMKEGLEEACAVDDMGACRFPYDAYVSWECQEVEDRTCADIESLLQ
ncbi:hypothetical protein [Sorangium sp. So ce176]|uniref:hypothetical protein n=1 Tax=Sorangium sp. So ce176 TaxID=3133286 RepID=UPI003F60AF1C